MKTATTLILETTNAISILALISKPFTDIISSAKTNGIEILDIINMKDSLTKLIHKAMEDEQPHPSINSLYEGEFVYITASEQNSFRFRFNIIESQYVNPSEESLRTFLWQLDSKSNAWYRYQVCVIWESNTGLPCDKDYYEEDIDLFGTVGDDENENGTMTGQEWYNVSTKQNLSFDFINDNKDKLFWSKVCKFTIFGDDEIRQFSTYVDWDSVCQYQNLSESIMSEFFDKINWHIAVVNQNRISDEILKRVIDEHKYLIDAIQEYQHLSEDIIRYISIHSRVNWYLITNHQYPYLSEEFKQEYKSILSANKNSDNMLFKSKETKKKMVSDAKVYDCYDEYFIAYKAIRNDNYSYFGFAWNFIIGNTYVKHADFLATSESFGFHITPKDVAKRLGDKVIKVKVYYDDLSYISDQDEAACSKIEVLSEEE